MFYDDDLAYIHAAGFGDTAPAAAAHILDRLAATGLASGRIVELGCGPGHAAAAFLAAGYVVTAADASAAMIALARQQAPGAQLVHSSLYDLDLPDCVAVAAIGEAFNYHDAPDLAEARLGEVFRAARDALVPGGLQVFDVIVAGGPPLDARGWRSGDDWAVLVEVREDAQSRTLVRAIETFHLHGGAYRRQSERHLVRIFDVDWLHRELVGLGFALETARGYGGCALPPRRLAFTARKL
jgi:SAM-dependent methyltransferase